MTRGRSKELVESPKSAPETQHCGADETESRIRRPGEPDGDIHADTERRQGTTPRQRKRQRGSHPGIPAPVRKEITRAARELNRQCRKLFLADPGLKDRAARMLRSLLPPKVKRGRPGMPAVTAAVRLLHQLKRQYPHERPAELWKRVYPAAINGYESMSPIEKKTAREVLRERVRWRRRCRLR
jgi:hypothetical protein